MKLNETNTAPITPTAAHRELAQNIMFYHTPKGSATAQGVRDAAQLIADSEARALAEIRDHFAKLTITSAQLADSNVGLRQERDQLRAEVERLKTCGMTELAAQNSSVADYCKHWEARAEQAEAELAAEREKVRVLRDALIEIMENTFGWKERTAREALESTENVA
jgi:hypothetical protein